MEVSSRFSMRMKGQFISYISRNVSNKSDFLTFLYMISNELAVIERLVNLVYNLVNLMSILSAQPFSNVVREDLSKEKLINLF